MLSPTFNRNRRKLRSLRNNYRGQTKRPVEIPNYIYNWVLLEEGLDVYWNNIKSELLTHVHKNNLEMIKIYLRSSYFRGIKIKKFSNYNPEIISLLISAGVKVHFFKDIEAITLERINIVINNGAKIKLYYSSLETSIDKVRDYVRAGAKVICRGAPPSWPYSHLQELRSAGVKVTLGEIAEDYYSLKAVINVCDNLKNLSDQNVEEGLLKEYMKFIKIIPENSGSDNSYTNYYDWIYRDELRRLNWLGENEAINSLLVLGSDYHLLKYINDNDIQLGKYYGINDTLDLLIERQPSRNMKSAIS